MSKNFKKKGPFSSDDKKNEKGPFSFQPKQADKKYSRASERNSDSREKGNEHPYKKNFKDGKPEQAASFKDQKTSSKTEYKKPFKGKFKKDSGKIEIAGKGRSTGYRKKDISEKSPRPKNNFTERRDNKRPDERTNKSFSREEKPGFKKSFKPGDPAEASFKKKQSTYSNWKEKAGKADFKKPTDRDKRENKSADEKPVFKKTFGAQDRPKGFIENSEDRKDKSFRKAEPDKRNFKDEKYTKRPVKKLPFSASREKSDDIPEYNLKRPMKAKKDTKEKSADPDGLVRLNKYISNAGLCSRRDADKMIQEGLIKVNGKVVTELGYKIKPTDTVQHSNQTLKKERPVYVLLNKPKDFITTTDDPGERKTVMDLVAKACKERIYPVGRLDRNTTGLLLLTNDGELADKLTHPSNGIKKVYQADLDRPLEKEDFEKIIEGLQLEDGPVQVDDLAYVSTDHISVGIEIHEGRNRIVRRIFEHLGYEVVKLDRVLYAGLTKKDLPRGHWRHLSEKEVVQLKFFI
jgi:23S rRNA pseudouridine2605 synthase